MSPTAECPTAQPPALWSCRALLDSPPAPLLQQNFSPERRLAATRGAAAAVLLLHAPSGSAATGRSLQPAALFLASTVPRPHAAEGCRTPGAPPGHPRRSVPLLRVGAFGRRVLVGGSVACGGLREGEVMHPRSLRPAVAVGRHLCCSRAAQPSKAPQCPQTQAPLGVMPCLLLASGCSAGMGLTLPDPLAPCPASRGEHRCPACREPA